MPKLTIASRSGAEEVIEAEPGLSLMEIIRGSKNDELLAVCGGSCACATCHVYIEPSFINRLPKASENENDLLDSSDHRQAGSRLACQVKMLEEYDGMRVTIAPED